MGPPANQTFYPGEGIDRISGAAGIDTVRYDDLLAGMDGGDVLKRGIEITSELEGADA